MKVAVLASVFLLFVFSLNARTNLPGRPPLFQESSSTEERFLAYLPHSGLSNQRIELANALLLAALLNRTLIVPPAFLGNVVGWMKSEQLFDHLGWLTNTSLDFETICRPPTLGDLRSYVRLSRCTEYTHFAAIHWTDLHDLGSLAPYVRVWYQTAISLPDLQQKLGVSDNDTFVYQDEQLYDWRLYEDPEEAREKLALRTNYIDSFTGRKYYKVYTLDYWRNRPERLLQLGSVFGSTRLSIHSPGYLVLKNQIAEALQYRLDTPVGETVRNIVHYLGGKGSFMAVHFRTGDKPFEEQLEENMFLFAKGMAELTGASMPQPSDLNMTETRPLLQLIPPKDGLDMPPWSSVCRNVPTDSNDEHLQRHGARTLIYIATDHHTPRAPDSRLLPWFNFFPCTIVLDDLPKDLFAPLDQLHDILVPAKSLWSYLLPLVDAMVAAHAKEIFTTPRSTFSKYIGDLHDAWFA